MFNPRRKQILFNNNNKPKQIFDVDAQKFITLAAITNNTQKIAINNLYLNLKGIGNVNTTHNFYENLTAFWPFVGGNSVSCSYNGVNPSSSNPYNLIFSGGNTINNNGVKFNGINGYADTGIPQNAMLRNVNGFSAYVRENDIRLESYIGHQSRPSFTETEIGWNAVPQWAGSDKFSGASGTTIQLNRNGLIRVNRNNSANYIVFRNGLQIELITAASEANTDVTTFLLGAQRVFQISPPINTAQNFSNKTFCYAEISNSHSMSTPQELIYYNCIQAFQTELGRQV
jgi:hypothetical protein